MPLSKEAVKEDPVGEASVTSNDSTQRKPIASYLKPGVENVVYFKELKELTGIHDERLLRKRISEEREERVILSKRHSGGGYWLPSDGADGKAEIEAYIRPLEAEAKSIRRSLKIAKRELKRLDGQQSLFDNTADSNGGDNGKDV